MKPDAKAVKTQILEAFKHVEYPGDWCLRDSNQGDEPFLLEQQFKGKTDWRTLHPSFIDQAPNGFGSALSFFSDEAFRFYIPAYLMASIDDALEQADPLFHLCHGFDDESKSVRVNPLRYGERTWFDRSQHRFSVFNRKEATAIVAYLRLRREMDEFNQDMIDQSLKNYWLAKIG